MKKNNLKKITVLVALMGSFLTFNVSAMKESKSNSNYYFSQRNNNHKNNNL